MKTILSILAIILLLSLVLNGWLIWDKKQAQKERFADNSKLNEVIASKQAEFLQYDSVVKATREHLSMERVKDSMSIAGLKQANSRLALKIHQLRPLIAPELAQNDTLNAFVSLQDSLLASKDTLITKLELSHNAEVVDLEVIIHEQSRQIMAQAAISDAWRQTAEQTQKDVAKERKKKNFFKITSGILTAGILFMAVRE